jgi:hypothetical protein
MKHRHLLTLMLIAVVAIPISGWAQALFDPSKTVYDASRLFPIVAPTDIVGADTDPVSKDVVNKIYDRCLSRVPPRFTPDAHNYYCACAAAATHATITNEDLKQLQSEKNRKLGNKSFEKYVHEVMKPCMDIPVGDTEYMYCVMNRHNDWRIKFPLPFCQCVSKGVQSHFEESGEEDMMVSWGNTGAGYRDPIDALWYNHTFNRARESSKDKCVGSYMDPKYFNN